MGRLARGGFQQAVTGVEPQWFDEESFLACASVEGRTVLYRLYLDGRVEKIFDELLHLTGATIISEDELFINRTLNNNGTKRISALKLKNRRNHRPL